MAIVQAEELRQWKIPVTTGIELVTFWIIAQCLNKLRHHVPQLKQIIFTIARKYIDTVIIWQYLRIHQIT